MNPQAAYEARTEKLYESDGLLTKFDAVILDCIPDGDRFLIELDQTAFFPEGGGQAADTGVIGGARISHAFIKDGRIYHDSDKPFAVGESVSCEIDLIPRRKRMQNHGAEHIISGLIHSLYGINNAGFHMSEGEITVDTAAPLSDEMVAEVERRANQAVWEDRAIECFYPSPEELIALPYRSKTEIDGDLRIVRINGIDTCACCAPHFRSTSPIGLIKIKGFIKYKRGSRLTVAAGEDAFENYLTVYDQAREVARLYSAVPEEILSAVKQREDFILEKLAEIRALKERILRLRLESILPTRDNICVFEENCDATLLKKLANEGVALTDGLFCAFSENSDGTYSYVIVTKEGELSSLAASIRESLGGRGGGRGTMISGFVTASREKIENFFS